MAPKTFTLSYSRSFTSKQTPSRKMTVKMNHVGHASALGNIRRRTRRSSAKTANHSDAVVT